MMSNEQVTLPIKYKHGLPFEISPQKASFSKLSLVKKSFAVEKQEE